jgi:hypothetical protein
MKFGAITPVCLLPASFGDSFQINARFNLQLLPTVFPIQTQLYVRLHFVYVRTRTLWEDWMSFFGGDETVTPPWIDPTAEDTPQGHKQFNISDDLQTGTLADYLGVPTTITGSYGYESESNRSTYDRLKGISFSDGISSNPEIAHPVFPVSQYSDNPDSSIAVFYNRLKGQSLKSIFVTNNWEGRSAGYKSNYFGVPYVWNAASVGIDSLEFRIPTEWFSTYSSPFWIGFYDASGNEVANFSYDVFNAESVKGNHFVVSIPKSSLTGVVQLVFWVDIRKVKPRYAKVVRIITYSNGSQTET